MRIFRRSKWPSPVQFGLTSDLELVKCHRDRPKWRNRQTRYVQGVVSFMLMWVRLPPSALKSWLAILRALEDLTLIELPQTLRREFQ